MPLSVAVGLDAAGKTTILYKLKLGEIVTTIPTIGEPWGEARVGRSAVAGLLWIRFQLCPDPYLELTLIPDTATEEVGHGISTCLMVTEAGRIGLAPPCCWLTRRPFWVLFPTWP